MPCGLRSGLFTHLPCCPLVHPQAWLPKLALPPSPLNDCRLCMSGVCVRLGRQDDEAWGPHGDDVCLSHAEYNTLSELMESELQELSAVLENIHK